MADNRDIDAVERNEQRASCALAAVTAYASAKSQNATDYFDFDSEPPQDRLTDLLADLRHWAQQNGLDFEQADRIAAGHVTCELDEETADLCVQEGGEA